MPVYNCEEFIEGALKSILDQSFTDFEIIIIDDCSTDATCDIIDTYKEPSIRLIKKPEHKGLIHSLNIGIKLSNGKYIARMDGDDISHPDRFEKQVNFLNINKEVVLCGTWYQLLSTKQIIRNPETHEDIKIALLDYCAFGHPTVMFRKQFILDNNLKYDTDFRAAEDYNLWTQIILLGKVSNIPETLLYYRSHINQISNISQHDQVKNSNLCKSRMLCYPISKPSETDMTICRTVVQNAPLEDSTSLNKIILWLDNLVGLNNQSTFFLQNEFKKLILQKKRRIVRRFYLNTSSYNPRILLEFKRSNNKFQQYFTFAELVKFALKCLLYWR